MTRGGNPHLGAIGAIVSLGAGGLDDGRQANADERLCGAPRLPRALAPVGVIRQLQSPLEAPCIIAGVIGHAGRSGVGEGIGRDEVLPAYFSRVEIKVVSDQIDRPFRAKCRFGASGATVGPGGWLVGEDAPHLDADRWYLVWPGDPMAGQIGNQRGGHQAIGPQIGDDTHAQAQDGAIALHGCFDIGRMAAAVEGEHVFLAVRHPLHRLAQDQGEIWYDHIFGEHTTLFAEAPSHVGCDNAHPAPLDA